MPLLKKQNLLLFIFILMFVSSCKNEDSNNSPITPKSSDYTDLNNWMSLPHNPQKKVDVFYVYPTSWTKKDSTEPNICEITHPDMRTWAQIGMYAQASLFDTLCNIYAPYYRQADAAYVLTLPTAKQEEFIKGIPYIDVEAAFDYYIKNYNNGRPFILAGHSQGSAITLLLLSNYMKTHPDVYKRMVAAYVIGYSVTNAHLALYTHLKFAQGPDDTGVIISYNTEAPEISGENPVLLPGANIINPINWKTDETPALVSENLGSFLPINGLNFTKLLNVADAKINKTRGSLICSTADVNLYAPGSKLFARGIFHTYDYQFYYYNLRSNAVNRINKYFAKNRI